MPYADSSEKEDDLLLADPFLTLFCMFNSFSLKGTYFLEIPKN